jgi:SAM-dependent methyltransferase
MTDEHTRVLDTEVPNLLGPTIRRSTPLPHDKVADGVLKGTLAQGVVAPGHADRSRPEASDTSEAIYILGHSQAETRRLINQAAILGSTTERLLRSAGIEHGMRVLDVGCGAGDVSMLAGKLVGASGSVVGIDPNAQILTVARARARADETLHVTFIEASIGTFSDPRPFDLVVARYVLIHQTDPVAFLRAAARFARPRGILALHELLLDAQVRSRPPVALWQQTVDWILPHAF